MMAKLSKGALHYGDVQACVSYGHMLCALERVVLGVWPLRASLAPRQGGGGKVED